MATNSLSETLSNLTKTNQWTSVPSNATHTTPNPDGSISWRVQNWTGNPLAWGTTTKVYDGGNAYWGLQDMAINSLQNNLSSAQGAVGSAVASAASQVTASEEAARAAAAAIEGRAKEVASSAYKLDPHIDNLSNASKQLLNYSNELYTMDADPNSLMGQYISSVKAIDPDRYVSMAASDVQNSFSNVEGQMQRAMSRQGMTSSAKAAALQKNWGVALASALAGAKTKARQTGITERLNALKESLGMANEMQKQAVDQETAAVSARVAQTDALAKAGNLTTAAANIIMEGINASNVALNTQVNAAIDGQNLISDMQNNIAAYYVEMANMIGSSIGHKKVMNSLYS